MPGDVACLVALVRFVVCVLPTRWLERLVVCVFGNVGIDFDRLGLAWRRAWLGRHPLAEGAASPPIGAASTRFGA